MATVHPSAVAVVSSCVDEADVDAMGSCVGKKQDQRWRWHASDERSRAVVASVCGQRQDEVFLQLKTLLAPCGIFRYATDAWGAYGRHLAPKEYNLGKRHTRQIERKYLTVRTRITRLVRQTISFSTFLERHDIVLGLSGKR